MSIDHSSADTRNELARERTVLANERTLLAYVRTALMLLASGITLVRILRVDAHLRLLGYVLIPVSVIVGVAGYLRFTKTRRELRMVGKRGTGDSPGPGRSDDPGSGREVRG